MGNSDRPRWPIVFVPVASLCFTAPAFGESAQNPQTASPQSSSATPASESAQTNATTPAAASGATTAGTPDTLPAGPLEQVIITAPRSELLGVAQTSSQGIILPEEIHELPAFRPGQL